MRFKDGVYTEVTTFKDGKKIRLKVSKKIEIALDVADALSKAISGKEIVITALFDGEHMEGSKHYEGNGADIRKWIYKGNSIHTFVDNLKDNLGEDYDVVLESSHIHIEYDPKNKKL